MLGLEASAQAVNVLQGLAEQGVAKVKARRAWPRAGQGGSSSDAGVCVWGHSWSERCQMPASSLSSAPSCWPFILSAKSGRGDLNSCGKWLPDLWGCCEHPSYEAQHWRRELLSRSCRWLPSVRALFACLPVLATSRTTAVYEGIHMCPDPRLGTTCCVHQGLFPSLLWIQAQMNMVCHAYTRTCQHPEQYLVLWGGCVLISLCACLCLTHSDQQ